MTSSTLRNAWREISSRLPSRSALRTARRLVSRANAERDAGRFQGAQSLYEAALALVDAPRFRVQYGHSLKEAGDITGAEHQYLQARQAMPRDADLTIQLGHFYKVAGRLDEAEQAYRCAADLRPGWAEAVEELAALRGLGGTNHSPDGDAGEIIEGLLPLEVLSEPLRLREGFTVLRLGAARTFTRGGYRRVLRGVEAIRGFVISSRPLGDIVVQFDGREIERVSPQAWPIDGGQTKYVFNIWHDFSDYTIGSHEIDLIALERGPSSRRHRAIIDLVPPASEVALPLSDAIIDSAPKGRSLEDHINAKPSIARPARRAILPFPAHILVQRVDQLGDLACSVDAIRRLRTHYPDAMLVGLVTEANQDLARTLALFDRIEVAHFEEDPLTGRRSMTAKAQRTLRERLSAYQFDLAIDLGEGSGSRPLLRLSGATLCCGFKGREFPWLDIAIDLAGHDPANQLEVIAPGRKLLAFVEALITLTAEAPSLAPYTGSRATLAHLPLGERYAVLHMGARLAYSRWPGFPALAELLLRHTDMTVVVMGANASDMLPDNDRLLRLDGLQDFTLFETLLAEAAVFIGNDSGPKHLAALRGTPVVSLHMARLNWNEWGQERRGTIMSRRVPCAGCGISTSAEECGRDFACLRLITANEVLEQTLRLLPA